jgi:hypothetical protein
MGAYDMVMIRDFKTHVGNVVEGNFRLSRVFSSASTDYGNYLIAVLEDCSGIIHCSHWTFSSLNKNGKDSNIFHCKLLITQNSEVLKADLITAQPYKNAKMPLLLLPYSSLPKPSLVGHLHALIEQCPIMTLRQFLNDVFSDDNTAFNFFRLPASREHHHADPGGLAEHSLEVATIVFQSLWQCDHDEFWLAIVAGLLHDIGKLRTFKNGGGGGYSNIGFIVPHEQLTLEVLAGPLKQLDTNWPDGAIALRYLLTRSPQVEKRPLMPCSLAIEYADKMSSAQSTHAKAFNQKPDWQRFAKLNVRGPKSLFWRPKPSEGSHFSRA